MEKTIYIDMLEKEMLLAKAKYDGALHVYKEEMISQATLKLERKDIFSGNKITVQYDTGKRDFVFAGLCIEGGYKSDYIVKVLGRKIYKNKAIAKYADSICSIFHINSISKIIEK